VSEELLVLPSPDLSGGDQTLDAFSGMDVLDPRFQMEDIAYFLWARVSGLDEKEYELVDLFLGVLGGRIIRHGGSSARKEFRTKEHMPKTLSQRKTARHHRWRAVHISTPKRTTSWKSIPHEIKSFYTSVKQRSLISQGIF
jgi:hypothetical protein